MYMTLCDARGRVDKERERERERERGEGRRERGGIIKISLLSFMLNVHVLYQFSLFK